MRKWLVGIITLSLLVRAGAEELEWLTDVPAAMEKAKAENKIVLLDFTGSDWCGWCKKLKAEVFDTPQFAAFARANFVMVELDYPRTKPQSPELKQANAALAQQYQVNGYPTVILLNAAGEQLDKSVGFITAGLPGYIERYNKLPGIRHPDPTAEVVASGPDNTPDPPRHAPVYNPLPRVAEVHYDGLALKGISIAPSGRMAMINGETLMVGESAKVKVGDGRVEVVCKEIRDDSVLITADGKPVELKMGQ